MANTVSSSTDGEVDMVSDDALMSNCAMGAIMGSLCLALFCVLQRSVRSYRHRLHCDSVAVKPPAPTAGGLASYISWAWLTMSTSDEELLKSAGLDALIMVKTIALGVQIFAMLTLVCCGMLLPLHSEGTFLQGNTGSISSSVLMRYTIANLDGNDRLWVHFFLVYGVVAWALFLMRWHYKQYVIVRQHYNERGDDPAEWRMLFESSFEDPEAHNNKLLALVESIAKMNGQRAGAPAAQQAPSVTRTLSGGTESAFSVSIPMPPPPPNSAMRASTTVFTNPLAEGPGSGPSASFPSMASAASASLPVAPLERVGSDGSPARRQHSIAVPRVFRQGSLTITNQAMALAEAAGGQSQSDQVSATASGVCSPSTTVHSPKVVTARPSIGYRKTVSAYTEGGRHVAVHAQNYAVLVTDVREQWQTCEDDEVVEITGRLAQLAEAIWSPIKALFMYPISSLKARRLEFFGSGGSADLLQAQRTPQTRRPRGPWSAGPTPPRSPERTAAPSPTKDDAALEMTNIETARQGSAGASGPPSRMPRALKKYHESLEAYRPAPSPPSPPASSRRLPRHSAGGDAAADGNAAPGAATSPRTVQMPNSAPPSSSASFSGGPGHLPVSSNAITLDLLGGDYEAHYEPPSLDAVRKPPPGPGPVAEGRRSSVASDSGAGGGHERRGNPPPGAASGSATAGAAPSMIPAALAAPAERATVPLIGADSVGSAEDLPLIATEQRPRWGSAPLLSLPAAATAVRGKRNSTPSTAGAFAAPSSSSMPGGNARPLGTASAHPTNTALQPMDSRFTIDSPSGSEHVATPLPSPRPVRNAIASLAAQQRWKLVREALAAGRFQEVLLSEKYSMVTATFARLFPEDFDRAIPVCNHREVDMLMHEWDSEMAALERCEAVYRATGQRPSKRRHCCGWIGSKYDSITHHLSRIKMLERAVADARRRALEAPTSSWFVFFRSPRATVVSTRVLLHSEDNTKFQVRPAPGPEEVNWPTLWRGWRSREARAALVIPFIVLLVLLPVSLATGALASVEYAFCAGSNSQYFSLRWSWYCQQESVAARYLKVLVTGFLPGLLLNAWQMMIMPRLVYVLAQAEGGCFSLSDLDKRIGGIYWWWDIFNAFLGGILGATVVQQINNAIDKPSQIIKIIGAALPASSNFFIGYVSLRALLLTPLRLLVPFPAVLFRGCAVAFRWLFCCGRPPVQSARERAEAQAGRSPRYGFEYGQLMLMFLIGLAFCVISPLVLPFTLAFFLGAWMFWRYQALYVLVRKYESGGGMWQYAVDRVIACLWIFQTFTSCVLMAKGGYIQAAGLWVSVPIALVKFKRYCRYRFQVGVDSMPLEMAVQAPLATVDPRLYLAPPLQHKGLGWYPEWAKVWEGWGLPAHV